MPGGPSLRKRGRIPDQGATFTCSNDGDQGLVANTCADGYTCLHHDCYAACDLDAGVGGGSAAAVTTESCKDVTIETGT